MDNLFDLGLLTYSNDLITLADKGLLSLTAENMDCYGSGSLLEKTLDVDRLKTPFFPAKYIKGLEESLSK